LRHSGFDTFIGAFSRWNVSGTDVYGESPATDALPDVKQLQFEQKRKSEGIDVMVKPPLQAPSALKKVGVKNFPGGITYYAENTETGAGMKPLYDYRPDLSWLQEDMRETQRRINEAFYVDLFRMLALSDRRQITATEVAQRHEEKLIMLGPMLERFQHEQLDPSVDITFYHMQKAGLVPPPPVEIGRGELKVEYISLLAQAQKAVGVGAIERLVGFVGNIAGAKPDALDKIDSDQAIDEYAEMLGTPPKIVRSDDVVQAERDARAEAAAQQQMAQQASGLAQGAKVLSEADTGRQNLLTDVLSGVAGANGPGA